MQHYPKQMHIEKSILVLRRISASNYNKIEQVLLQQSKQNILHEQVQTTFFSKAGQEIMISAS